jgi:hypothetical protein
MTRCRVKELVAGEGEIRNAIDRHFHHLERAATAAVPRNEVQVEAPADSDGPEEESAISASMRPQPTRPLSAEAAGMIPAEVAAELKDLRTRLEKATRVLRALVEVGEAKGLFTADDLRVVANRKNS